MNRRYRTWHEVEVEYYRKHPAELREYLDVALEEAENDGDWKAFLETVRVSVEVVAEPPDSA